jgi:hypothetical protein
MMPEVADIGSARSGDIIVYSNPHMAADVYRYRQDDLRRSAERARLRDADRFGRPNSPRLSRRIQMRRLLAAVVSRIDNEDRHIGAAGRSWT